MFIEAIEKAAAFTRPLHSIMRSYGGKQVLPGAGTLFFVNDEGYAITCKHVLDILAGADTINNNYNAFKQERQAFSSDNKHRQLLKGLELKYKYTAESIVQVKNNFVDCVDTMSGFTWHTHPSLDLAILKFNGYGKTFYTEVARFLKNDDDVKQGKFLCRLGFPFPEFTNFAYNAEQDDIHWTTEGVSSSPRFPIEGMITRFLANQEEGLFGIEMSTPGLKGQSGGPLFDNKGLVYGMQFSTKHLHLGFDMIDKEIMLNTGVKKISDYAFLHLGQCIHVKAIKAFLRQHNVKFYEE
ncbi:MAG: serine protease [Ferruginibacter sp.]